MGNTQSSSSVGIELEFLIAAQVGREPLNVPPRFLNSRGKPIIVPHGKSVSETIKSRVEEVIEAAIEKHKGDRVVSSIAEVNADVNAYHLRNYLNWDVKRDMSVTLPDNLLNDPVMSRYQWQDLELATPAFFATEKSWEEIHRVVTALNENFWVFCPESTGLHVHYGRGKHWMNVSHLSNLAAFLYAADPIITQMHPEHRHGEESIWCKSNRLYSILAHGVRKEQATQYIYDNAGEVKPISVPDNESDRPDPEPKRSRRKSSQFVSIFPRGYLEGYTFDQEHFNMTFPNFITGRSRAQEGGEVSEPVGIVSAAEELFSATHPNVISLLMGYAVYVRMAYNFTAYDFTSYRRVEESLDGPRETQPRRTIEFRQATGTVDPDEVLAQGKVAVRLCEIAGTKSKEDLWKMILDFAQAETHPTWYDVFDLLLELDLVDEARVIQRQMAKYRGIEIIDEDRGFARGPPPERPKGWAKFKATMRSLLSASDRRERALLKVTEPYRQRIRELDREIHKMLVDMGTEGIPPA
ncbi:putative amidoligase enzyme-domain-containing protein [Hypoxylon sp. FL0543]|nr:putative amidoligase enzyme-domain-containing protein [Hypoxylon sp. FL0543]